MQSAETFHIDSKLQSNIAGFPKKSSQQTPLNSRRKWLMLWWLVLVYESSSSFGGFATCHMFPAIKKGHPLGLWFLQNAWQKVTKYSPNGGVMVIYHGTKGKKQLQQIQAWSYTFDHFWHAKPEIWRRIFTFPFSLWEPKIIRKSGGGYYLEDHPT